MLLLSTLDRPEILHAIASIKLNINFVAQASSAAIKTSSLDNDFSGHDVQFGEQARSTVGAEEVVVNLARGASDGALLGGSCAALAFL